MERRDFLRMAAATAALVAAPRTSRAATARVDVLVNEPIGPITADFYGHFVEHLGKSNPATAVAPVRQLSHH